MQAAVDAGDITIVGEAYTDGWLPANAQRNMEQILTAQDNGVDAVVASNDGTAGGVVAALTAQGMDGIPVSGQDGDHAALNRVAKGTQTVSVWKDARELGKAAGQIAVALAKGVPWRVRSMDLNEWTSPGGTSMNAIFLAPNPITAVQSRCCSSMQAGSLRTNFARAFLADHRPATKRSKVSGASRNYLPAVFLDQQEAPF